MKQRLGVFYITREVIEGIGDRNTNRMLLKIMSRCIIVSICYQPELALFEYHAFSFDFDMLEDARNPPIYKWVVTTSPGKDYKRNSEKTNFWITAARQNGMAVSSFPKADKMPVELYL